MGQMVNEEFVHTYQLLSLVGHHAEVLIELRLRFGGTIEVEIFLQQIVNIVSHSSRLVKPSFLYGRLFCLGSKIFATSHDDGQLSTLGYAFLIL